MASAAGNSIIWRFTMALTGVGSTMLGPLLPQLLHHWRLNDHQGGTLVACLFLGSFSGTLALSERLDRCLGRGAWLAAIGCFTFGTAIYLPHGFVSATLALLVMGFGMGHLMSSLNLLVGSAAAELRARELALLSASWCAGAVLSPCLSTVVLTRITPGTRLELFALLFLVPLAAIRGDKSSFGHSKAPASPGWSSLLAPGVVVCSVGFLVYGGVEASISAWMPEFATRYSGGPIALTQWILSLFWSGLIFGRMAASRIVTRTGEAAILRVSILVSIACLTWLLVSSSFVSIAVGSVIMGTCLAPLFPLLLSTTLSYGYSNRTMGFMLACCALGSAMFPFALGILSTMFSLRLAMLLPIAGLLYLFLFHWTVPRYKQIVMSY